VPSFSTHVDRPVAKSEVSALNTVEDMTVPVTTGWPELLIENTPAENDMCYPSVMDFTTFLLLKMVFLVIAAFIYGIIAGLRGPKPPQSPEQ